MHFDEMLSRVETAKMYLKIAEGIIEPVLQRMQCDDMPTHAQNSAERLELHIKDTIREAQDIDFLIHEKMEGPLL